MVHKVIACGNCGSQDVEPTDERKIADGAGNPVLATSYECQNCKWKFIVNELIGLAPQDKAGEGQ